MGHIYKRCSKCGRSGANFDGQRCPKCNERCTWALMVDIPSSDGTRKRRCRQGFATKREAANALAELQTDVSRGSYVEPKKLTVRDYLVDKWLPSVKGAGDVRASTYASYELHVRHHIVPRIGQIRLQQLGHADVRRLYSELGEAGLSKKSVRNIHLTLHKALADAVEDQLLTATPRKERISYRVSALR